MDCKTARLLIDFARPNASELEPRDAEELAGHLDQCPDCGPCARFERELDECVGRAMCRVEVPALLHKNLMARLGAERGDWYRHRIGHAVRAVAVAAAILLAVWGLVRWSRGGPTPINPDNTIDFLVQLRISPTPEKVQEALRALNSDAPIPAELNYLHLAAPPALAQFQNERGVPMLVFVNREEKRSAHDRALVYLLSAQRFDLKNLPANLASSGSFQYRIEVVRQDADHAFLVLHTGNDWNWLRSAATETQE